TWQRTRDYRRRFGFWNYHADHGTAFVFAGEGGSVCTAGAGLRIRSESGEWVNVPPEIAEKGTVLVNAFVHPFSNFGIWAKEPARFGLSTAPTVGYRVRLPSTFYDDLWSILQHDRRDWRPSLDSLPPQVLVSCQDEKAKQIKSRFDTFGEQRWDWPSE